MSTEPEFGNEMSPKDDASEKALPGKVVEIQIGERHVQTNGIGVEGVTGLVTALGATVTAVSVTVKAKIEARADVRKAEIEAETRRLEIAEETKREEMRLQAGQQVPAPAEDD